MSNSYKKAMDKFVLSDELKSKIVQNTVSASKEAESGNRYKPAMDGIRLSDEAKKRIAKNAYAHRQAYRKRVSYINRAASIAACFLLLTISVPAMQSLTDLDGEPDTVISEYTVTGTEAPTDQGTAKPQAAGDTAASEKPEPHPSSAASGKKSPRATDGTASGSAGASSRRTGNASHGTYSVPDIAASAPAATAIPRRTPRPATSHDTSDNIINVPSSGTAAAPRSDYEQSSDVTDDNTVIDFSDGTAPSTNSSAASAAAPTPAAPTVAAAVPTAEPDKEDEAPPLMQGSAGSGTYDNDELPSYAQSPYYEGGTYGYYEASDLADLKASAAYELNAPSYMPDSYSADAYALISGSLAQIRYFNGTDEILYRTEPGTEDCSGNYSVYDTEKEIKVNDITVTLKINNTSGFLATWQKDNMVYSLDGTGSVSEAEITRIISSICPVA